MFLFGFGSNIYAVSKAYKVEKLPTGLEIISIESHKVPLVTIVLAVKAGGMTETADIDGLTHLWEHMFFKGNKRLPDQEAFKKRIRQLGIVYNGDTSAEKVRYYFTLPAAFLDEGLQFMADAISTPLLDEKELAKERHVVMDEYDRAASSPGFDLGRIRQKLIYGDQSYRRDPLGQRPIIAKASRKQLLRIKDEVFVPSNSAIMVAGDFEPKVLKALVNKHFGSWKDPKDWKPIPAAKFQPFPKPETIVFTHKQARNVSIQMTYEGPKARSQPEDSFAADILISLLNHRSSKFYKKFVDSGLCFDAGLGYFTQSQAALIDVYLTTSAEKANKALTMLKAEVPEWAKPKYFTNVELEDVKRSLLINHKRELNKPSAFIKTLAFWWAITGLDYYGTYIDSLRKTTLKDVAKFVNKYLVKKDYITTYLMSPDEAKTMKLKDNSKKYIAKFKLASGGTSK